MYNEKYTNKNREMDGWIARIGWNGIWMVKATKLLHTSIHSFFSSSSLLLLPRFSSISSREYRDSRDEKCRRLHHVLLHSRRRRLRSHFL